MTVPEPHRVLIATASLSARSGTDLYTRDLALSLLRRGWQPVVYTSNLGWLAEELRLASIPVTDDIDTLGSSPDVIHGHHALETLTALARFRHVPALYVCHDSLTWHSIPPRSSRIQSWVAVDRNCRDRMVFEHGIAADSIHVLTNAVDLARFHRRAPLPSSPQRALVFNNTAVEAGYVAAIRAACEKQGIEVDLLGDLSGRGSWTPEEVLPAYDLVFARARCALEAAAVGNAVVLCDSAGMGGMLTSDKLEMLRALNFGRRTLQMPVTVETVAQQIERYDAADAAAVSDRIRQSASIDVLTEQFIDLYESLLGSVASVPIERELAELASALSAVTRRLPLRPFVPRRRQAILNSRLMVWPTKVARWIKGRLEL